MDIRPAERSETGALARLWYDAWQDAHAAIVPAALVRIRTLDSFAARLGAALGDLRVVGPVGAPLGFHLLKGDELYQFFVAEKARGAGVAAALIADAERRLARRGVQTAWLACAIGNDRAARFYEKSGWRRTGTVVSRLDTPSGPFDLDVWRYEKRFASADPA
jgi:GNAT superfamily N-acetyltransferase